jgi:hypothetical protein
MCKHSHIRIFSSSRILLSSLIFQFWNKNLLISNFHSFTFSDHQTLTIFIYIQIVFTWHTHIFTFSCPPTETSLFHDQVVTPRNFSLFLFNWRGAAYFLHELKVRWKLVSKKEIFCASWMLGAKVWTLQTDATPWRFVFPWLCGVHVV